MVGRPSLEKVHNYQIYQKYIIFNKNFFNVSAKAFNLGKKDRKNSRKKSISKKEVQIKSKLMSSVSNISWKENIEFKNNNLGK